MKITYCLSVEDRLKKTLVILSGGDLKENHHTHSWGQDSRFQVWLIKLIRFKVALDTFDNYLIKSKHYSWGSRFWKVLYLVACENIEINAYYHIQLTSPLGETSSVGSRLPWRNVDHNTRRVLIPISYYYIFILALVLGRSQVIALRKG